MTDLKPARSKLWDAPILRAFAPPAEPTAEGTETPVEITPWGQPGTRLRMKPGAANASPGVTATRCSSSSACAFALVRL